jgi:hypothetical protein
MKISMVMKKRNRYRTHFELWINLKEIISSGIALKAQAVAMSKRNEYINIKSHSPTPT